MNPEVPRPTPPPETNENTPTSEDADTEKDVIDSLSEEEAETRLEAILANPRNKFLQEFPANREAIENADTGKLALKFALTRINERNRREQEFRLRKEQKRTPGEGEKISDLDYAAAVEKFARIHAHERRLGAGVDGYVVVYTPEENGPCYKFSFQEVTPRGRNSMDGEIEIQEQAFKILAQRPGGRIRAPRPYYAQEVGPDKMIAMEKLPALSVNDMLCGMGTLPDWIDIDEFCAELSGALSALHEHHIYHRDMHLGNVMVHQGPAKEGQAWGYIIDFGLSGYSYDEETNYRLEVGNDVFTYRKDDSIIKRVQEALRSIRANQLKANGA